MFLYFKCKGTKIFLIMQIFQDFFSYQLKKSRYPHGLTAFNFTINALSKTTNAKVRHFFDMTKCSPYFFTLFANLVK